MAQIVRVVAHIVAFNMWTYSVCSHNIPNTLVIHYSLLPAFTVATTEVNDCSCFYYVHLYVEKSRKTRSSFYVLLASHSGSIAL